MLEVTPGNTDKNFPEAREVWETMEVAPPPQPVQRRGTGRSAVLPVTTPADTAEQTRAFVAKLSFVPTTPEGAGSIGLCILNHLPAYKHLSKSVLTLLHLTLWVKMNPSHSRIGRLRTRAVVRERGRLRGRAASPRLVRFPACWIRRHRLWRLRGGAAPPGSEPAAV